jgi:hypothetical protein
MRGFAVLLAYVVGLLTVIGGGTIGLMALNKLTPPVVPVAAAAPKNISPRRPSKRQLLKKMRNLVRSGRWRM